MDRNWFEEADIRQIREEKLTEMAVNEQLATFRAGVAPLKINRPCTVGDGIERIAKQDIPALTSLHDAVMAAGRMIKFVPASGAASRMFRDWYRLLETGAFASPEEERTFAADLPKYAFYEDLETLLSRNGTDVESLIRQRRYPEIVEEILMPEGLNYGRLPKALLKFHAYEGSSRTALEEHLVEAASYVRTAAGNCRIHLTVSEEHLRLIQDCLRFIQAYHEARLGVKFLVEISTQSPSTNTLAVDLENRPFRDGAGRLVFRPGGHGSLLTNLQDIDGDIIFLKNIDNIVPDRLKALTVLYKKVLCGYLLVLQKEIFRFQQRLDEGEIGKEDRIEMIHFCVDKLHLSFPRDFTARTPAEQAAFLKSKLARPLRVCGMVRNEGEPGGGPFWVDGAEGMTSLQVVEAFQVDSSSEEQQARWAAATHFNPVDLVCGVRDYRGRKYDLHRYVDPKAVCISHKSEKGRDLKALELPGLWNGAMALWNTVFVETPIETFNPVKTVSDLLRPQHLRE